jgi:predicted nucleotidyltransferase
MGVVRAVYLFGSQAEGRADSWSDIDLAVFMDEVEAWDLPQRARLMAAVQIEAGWDVEAHLFASRNLDHPEAGSFSEYILKHGVCLVRSSDELDAGKVEFGRAE